MTRPVWTFETSLGTGPLDTPSWTAQPYVRAVETAVGRQQELDVFQPGEATVRLYNRDRRFDPYHAAGPNYGNLLPRRRCRLRATIDATTYDVFSGFAQGWPVADGDLGASPVDLVDAFELLSSVTLEASPLEQIIAGLRPVHWWKLNDAEGSATVHDHGSGDVDGRTVGQAQDGLGATGLDPVTDTTALDLDASTGYVNVDGCADWTSFTALVRVDAFDPGSTTIFASPNRHVAVGASGVVSAHDTTDGVATTAVALTVGATSVVTVVRDGAGSFTIYVNGTARATSSAGALATVVTPLIGAFDASGASPVALFNGAVQHVATFDYALTADHAAALYDSWQAWDGDTTGDRIGRLLDLTGWPAADRDIDPGETILGPVTDWGSDALEMMRIIEATEGGALYQTPSGQIRFRSRYSPVTATRSTTVQTVFSDDPAAVDTVRYHSPVIPGQLAWIRNRITVTWVGGDVTVVDQDSIDAYGPVDHQVTTVLTSAIEARRLAEWVLDHYAEPQLRISELTVDLAAEPQFWDTVLGLQVGDLVTVEWTPGGTGDPISVNAHVEHISIAAAAGIAAAAATIGLSAADTITYWTWGTSTWGETTRWA